MSDDFVTPEAIRLPLRRVTVSPDGKIALGALVDGKFIDVKKRLNHGESDEMWARMSPYVVPGQEMRIDRREVRTAKVLAYLVGWSFTNNGAPVPMSPDLPDTVRISTINNLDPERFAEIFHAIEAHETAMEAERAREKNAPDGATASPAISPSPDAAAGATTGSAP
jgi:hypothetical protein